jgi:uncharacterized repeat protein (TIGR03803 family)
MTFPVKRRTTMTSTVQRESSISRIRLGAASTSLALAVVLLLAVIATPWAQAQTFSVLYSFMGGADGFGPNSGLVRDPAGNFYGTTMAGGAYNLGTVFKLDKTGKETVLYTFIGGTDGALPIAGLTRNAAGNLYGTTLYGGATGTECQLPGQPTGCGVVFKLDATGKETVLYTFIGGTDGAVPAERLRWDAATGNLYGATAYGGGTARECPSQASGFSGCGTVFKLDSNNEETILHSFTGGTEGRFPGGRLVRDTAGNLYGTTGGGGSCIAQIGCGVVFKLSSNGKETVLYSFAGQPDGFGPNSGLVRDPAGNFYGTTMAGGAYNLGTVFKLDKTGKETVLYSFAGHPDGSEPSSLVRDAAGNLYGTTSRGGTPKNNGTVFKLDTSGKETVLHTFCLHGPPCSDGRFPQGLFQDGAGNLYGVAGRGGISDYGTVFKLTP